VQTDCCALKIGNPGPPAGAALSAGLLVHPALIVLMVHTAMSASTIAASHGSLPAFVGFSAAVLLVAFAAFSGSSAG
jgi:hypothetical protein